MSEFVRPHYERAPIVEALIDIRFAEPDKISIEQLTRAVDAVADIFPFRQPIQQVEFGYQTQANVGGFNHAQLGWRLETRKHDRVLQLQRIGYTYSHMPPYSDWNAFRGEARKYWEVLKPALGDPASGRLAVRVINKIPTPRAEFDLRDYLNVYPMVPERMPATADAVFVQLQLAMPEILPHARAILNVASGQTDASGPHLLLDIDLFANRLIDNEEEIWSTLEKFGTEKDKIFETCITDKVREVIR